MSDENQKVTVHFRDGGTAVTLLTDEDLEDADVSTFEGYIEKKLTQRERGRYEWIGGIYVYNQAVSAVEMADGTS